MNMYANIVQHQFKLQIEKIMLLHKIIVDSYLSDVFSSGGVRRDVAYIR